MLARRMLSLLIVVAFAIPLVLFSAVPGFPQQTKLSPRAGDEFSKLGIRKFDNAPPARDFVLSDWHGNSVTLSAFRGSVVFLNFWATWCPPCRNEMYSMERLYRQLAGSGLVMLALDVKEQKSSVAKFMTESGFTFPALLDIDGRVAGLYGTFGLPNTYLIDRMNRLVGQKPGPRDWGTSDVLQFFRRLLQEGGSGSHGDFTALPLDSPNLAAVLYVKSSQAPVYAERDRLSTPVARLMRGDKLYSLGQANSGGEIWYVVKTQNGAVGWISAADIEAQSEARSQ